MSLMDKCKIATEECRVCGGATKVVFNIDFKAIPICESCAVAITVQQVKWWRDTQKKGEQPT